MKLLINEKTLLISLFFIIVAEVSIVAGNCYRTIAKASGDNRSIDNERGCYDALSRGESTSFFPIPLVDTSIPGEDPCPWTLKLPVNSTENLRSSFHSGFYRRTTVFTWFRSRASSIIFLIFLKFTFYRIAFDTRSNKKLFYVHTEIHRKCRRKLIHFYSIPYGIYNTLTFPLKKSFSNSFNNHMLYHPNFLYL